MSKRKLFIIDTIVSYRMKYVVEADELEHAFDEVSMKDSGSDDDYFDEVTQRCLGETITDGREISMKEFKKIMKDLSADKKELCSNWADGRIIRKINYDK